MSDELDKAMKESEKIPVEVKEGEDNDENASSTGESESEPEYNEGPENNEKKEEEEDDEIEVESKSFKLGVILEDKSGANVESLKNDLIEALGDLDLGYANFELTEIE